MQNARASKTTDLLPLARELASPQEKTLDAQFLDNFLQPKNTQFLWLRRYATWACKRQKVYQDLLPRVENGALLSDGEKATCKRNVSESSHSGAVVQHELAVGGCFPGVMLEVLRLFSNIFCAIGEFLQESVFTLITQELLRLSVTFSLRLSAARARARQKRREKKEGEGTFWPSFPLQRECSMYSSSSVILVCGE